jgi:hypothetical protein
MTAVTYQNLTDAYAAGRDAAMALKVGDVFTGAFGAFKSAGLDELFRPMFSLGFVHFLNRPVRAHFDTGVIVSLGED